MKLNLERIQKLLNDLRTAQEKSSDELGELYARYEVKQESREALLDLLAQQLIQEVVKNEKMAIRDSRGLVVFYNDVINFLDNDEVVDLSPVAVVNAPKKPLDESSLDWI